MCVPNTKLTNSQKKLNLCTELYFSWAWDNKWIHFSLCKSTERTKLASHRNQREYLANVTMMAKAKFSLTYMYISKHYIRMQVISP